MKRKYIIAFIEIAGIICFGIGITGVIGNVYNVHRMYDWIGNNVGMAFASGLVGVLAGISFLLVSSILKKHEKDSGKV